MPGSRAAGGAVAVVLALALALAAAPAARAFDTASHADITVDALRAEGFGATATRVPRVAKRLPDL